MSRNGVWQLKKLIVNWTNGGSSRGVIQMAEEHLEEFRRVNPQLEIEYVKIHKRHPSLIGQYVHGNQKVIGIKNQSPEQILSAMWFLRNQWGFKAKDFSVVRKTKRPSIQGMWTSKLLQINNSPELQTKMSKNRL